MQTTYLEALAHFISEAKWIELPDDVKHAAKRVFLDVLGANMRGSEEPENVNIGEFYKKMSGPNRTSTVLHAGFPLVDYLTAASVNGTQACAVELDDGYRGATAHSGAYVMSGTLALAEALESPVTEMLTAFVVGYDIASRGARAANVPKFVINQHGIMNVLGTAAAACVLKHRDVETTKEALLIAAALGHVTSYYVLQTGATVRNLWVGVGARDGLLAGEFAAMGYVGQPDGIRITFERAGATFVEEELLRNLGKTYCITQNYHKQYACNGNFDASIEGTLYLMKENAIRPNDIEGITIDIYAPYHTLVEARPRNPLAAKFSLRYTVAAVAVCGHADHEAFTMDKLKDPTILSLVDRTELREDPALAANVPVIRPSRVTIKLRDGRAFVKFVENPRGNYKNPFSDEELVQKFASLAGRYMIEQGVNSVRDYIKDPERVTSARVITDAMRKNAKT